WSRGVSADCCCRRWPSSGAGTGRRSCRRPASRPGCRPTPGGGAPGSTGSTPPSLADVQTAFEPPASSVLNVGEWAERLPIVTSGEEFEQEFERRLSESSTLAFRVAYGVLRHREDAED